MRSIWGVVRQILVVAGLAGIGFGAAKAIGQSQVVSREIRSNNFANNKIGVNPVRRVEVYLPAGYDSAAARYPVIYYLPNPLDEFRGDFYEAAVKRLMDRAIATGSIGPVILVAVDMATPFGCSWYVNSPVTGNWEDFVVKELVPYLDANFRTMASRDSRGIAGDFMGGYGAIRFGMTHPEVFGSVYAMHPVGTGSGLLTMYSRPDWGKLAAIRSTDELPKEVWQNIFLSIFQAHIPDVDKPPLFIDFQARKDGDKLVIDSAVTARLRDNFFIESLIPKYADNLKSLRGFKFDWSRNDGNQDHVYSNQALTHKLNEFGIEHEAEEYNGVGGVGKWEQGGRVDTDMLPFLGKYLVFEKR